MSGLTDGRTDCHLLKTESALCCCTLNISENCSEYYWQADASLYAQRLFTYSLCVKKWIV